MIPPPPHLRRISATLARYLEFRQIRRPSSIRPVHNHSSRHLPQRIKPRNLQPALVYFNTYQHHRHLSDNTSSKSEENFIHKGGMEDDGLLQAQQLQQGSGIVAEELQETDSIGVHGAGSGEGVPIGMTDGQVKFIGGSGGGMYSPNDVEMGGQDYYGVSHDDREDSAGEGVALRDLIKSSVFTESLVPDSQFPTPQDSLNSPRERLGPRQVRGAMFTYVTPEGGEPNPEILAVSDSAMKELGIKMSEKTTREFTDMMAGNAVAEGVMPWASAYGGWQFGQWAGQLGDGRAISLFETTNPNTGKRYEVQLKGAGLTPYSRFADGKAVLRSSIREFIVSEALHHIGIPTTRALALTLLPTRKAIRDVAEPCAVVCRFAPSWLRIGSFDLFRWRGDRKNLRKLADYAINEVFGGEDKLVPPRPGEEEWVGVDAVNRYQRLYREVVRRNAKGVAMWQSFGFMNGVLNTDNTHLMGLSLDFGPFSFMDTFDPNFTPNHDDYMRRYSYQNQPTVIWWNLVRFAEDIAELYCAGDTVDTVSYLEKGPSPSLNETYIPRAEKIIERSGEEYKDVFQTEYCITMCRRLGLTTNSSGHDDISNIIGPLLDIMREAQLDFNLFFRRLSSVPILSLDKLDQWMAAARGFFPTTTGPDGVQRPGANIPESKVLPVAEWLGGTYRTRLELERLRGYGRSDEERMEAMKWVNPKFIPRNWVLQEIIQKVEHEHDRDVLDGVMKMLQNPFLEEWGWNPELEARWCAEPAVKDRGMQCTCSS